MNETRQSYGSKSRQTRGPMPPIGGSSGRTPSNPRDMKAKNDVNDWAAKKKEQIERAKLLREERKYGSSHLRNGGENQMTPSSAIRNSNQGSTGQYSLQVPGQSSQDGFQPTQMNTSYNEYLSDNIPRNNSNSGINTAAKVEGRHSPMNYQNKHGNSSFDFSQNNSQYDPNNVNSATPTNFRRMGNDQNGNDSMNQGLTPGYQSIHKQNSQYTPAHGGFGGNQNPAFTNYDSNNGPDEYRHNTISHDLPRNSNYGNNSNTTYSGGFQQNPLSRRTPNGGLLNQTANDDPRNPMRSTAYSRQDVEEARSGLRLLKNKMDNLKQRKGISNSQNANRGDMDHLQSNNNNLNSGYIAGNRRANNYANGGKPPMLPPSGSHQQNDDMNTSSLSTGGGPSNFTPKANSNYRKVFQPGDPSGNTQASYEPEKRSGNAIRRQMSNSNPQNSRKMDNVQNSGAYDPSKYGEQSNPFGGGGGMGGGRGVQNSPPRGGGDPFNTGGGKGVQNSPPRGGYGEERGRPSPMQSQPKQQLQPRQQQQNYGGPSQPSQNSGGGGMNIYEKAAMEADPFSDPNSNGPVDVGDRIPCPICGRKFAPESLEKHQKICQKVFQQKRKAFNVKDQRKAEGLEEIERENKYNKPMRAAPKKAAEKPVGKMPKWKQQSLMLRQAMQASSGNENQVTVDAGGNFNPSQQASEPEDDRVQCKWCNRKFAEETAKRHMPHCETKYKANQMKTGGPPKRGTQVGFKKR